MSVSESKNGRSRRGHPLFRFFLGLLQRALGTAFASMIIFFLLPYMEEVRLWSQLQFETIELPISAKFDDISSLASFKYRLVHYGPDNYVTNPSTPDDLKRQGIWRLQDYPVELRSGANGDTILCLSNLPIHRVMGTVFKVFAWTPNPDDQKKLREKLVECCGSEFSTDFGSTGEVWLLFKREKYPMLAIDPSVLNPHIENNFISRVRTETTAACRRAS
jgi:hypothetical protein